MNGLKIDLSRSHLVVRQLGGVELFNSFLIRTKNFQLDIGDQPLPHPLRKPGISLRRGHRIYIPENVNELPYFLGSHRRREADSPDHVFLHLSHEELERFKTGSVSLQSKLSQEKVASADPERRFLVPAMNLLNHLHDVSKGGGKGGMPFIIVLSRLQ